MHVLEVAIHKHNLSCSSNKKCYIKNNGLCFIENNPIHELHLTYFGRNFNLFYLKDVLNEIGMKNFFTLYHLVSKEIYAELKMSKWNELLLKEHLVNKHYILVYQFNSVQSLVEFVEEEPYMYLLNVTNGIYVDEVPIIQPFMDYEDNWHESKNKVSFNNVFLTINFDLDGLKVYFNTHDKLSSFLERLKVHYQIKLDDTEYGCCEVEASD